MLVRARPLHIAVAVVLAALLAGLLIWRLHAPTDEELIERLIARTERAIEAQDVPGIMAAVSWSYSDSMGNNYLQLQALARSYAEGDGPMIIRRRSTVIEVNGDEATADITGAVRQGRGAMALVDALPGQGDLVRVILDLRRERGGWKIVSLRFADLKFD